MSSKHVSHVDDAGFSLLELVVSLLLLSMLTLTLTWSVHVGLRIWDNTRDGQARQRDVYHAQNALRLFLSSARSGRTEQTGHMKFEGEPDKVLFVATMPEQFGYGGDYQINLKSQRGADGHVDLVIEPQVYQPRAMARAVDQRPATVVLSHIQSLALRYMKAGDHTHPADWTSIWKDQTTLPDLIALDVAFNNADRRYWPTLIVAPRNVRGIQP